MENEAFYDEIFQKLKITLKKILDYSLILCNKRK